MPKQRPIEAALKRQIKTLQAKIVTLEAKLFVEQSRSQALESELKAKLTGPRGPTSINIKRVKVGVVTWWDGNQAERQNPTRSRTSHS